MTGRPIDFDNVFLDYQISYAIFLAELVAVMKKSITNGKNKTSKIENACNRELHLKPFMH